MDGKEHVIPPLDEFTEAVLVAKARARGITPEALIEEIVISHLNGIASSADSLFFDRQRFSRNLKN